MPRPRHPRPDANQLELVAALRQLGFIVHDVSSLGGDALDLFVGGYHGYLGRWVWIQVEVKTPEGKLTPEEAAYIEKYGKLLPVFEARTLEDVLDVFAREALNVRTTTTR